MFLLAVPAVAQQDPIVADRPGLADGPGVVGAGTMQLEFGVNRDDDGESLVTLPTLFRYGLSDALELRIESDVVEFSSGNRERAPIALGVKWRIREGDVPISLIASVQTEDVEGSVRITSDIDLGSGFSLTPNAGVSIAEGEDAVGVIAATVEHGFGNATPFVDFELQSGGGDTSMIFDAGVAWLVTNDTQLDVSAGVEVAGTAYPDWFIGAGISRRF